jgi:hypothetical protein
MKKIEEREVLDLVQYEKARPEFQKKAIAAKAVRRLAVGPLVTCFFENRLTMQYQLQEMLRVERVVRDEAVRDELQVWNDLVPGRDELSMTLMIEITDMTQPTVSMRIGRRKVPARFEEGWRDDNRISAVQFIRFALASGDRGAFLEASDVSLVIDHPAYRHEARLPETTLAALREDLETP